MNRRFSFLLTLALVQSLLAMTSRSQTFYFSDGRKASMPEAKIKGSNIIVPLKLSGPEGGSADQTLPISSLLRIDWPAPPAIAEADTLLNAEKPAEALKKIDAILSEQEPLREMPGSWWSKGAAIKAAAFAQLGKDVDADVMIERMRRAKADPADIAKAEIASIDALVAAGKVADATARLDKFQANVTDDAGLASIAVTKGQMLARAGQTEAALLSYLRVPVFYPSEDDKLPVALLGIATAYKKLGDDTRAAATLTTLTTRFPNSAEAAKAKR